MKEEVALDTCWRRLLVASLGSGEMREIEAGILGDFSRLISKSRVFSLSCQDTGLPAPLLASGGFLFATF